MRIEITSDDILTHYNTELPLGLAIGASPVDVQLVLSLDILMGPRGAYRLYDKH